MAQKWPKIAHIGPKMTQNGPQISTNWKKIAQIYLQHLQLFASLPIYSLHPLINSSVYLNSLAAILWWRTAAAIGVGYPRIRAECESAQLCWVSNGRTLCVFYHGTFVGAHPDGFQYTQAEHPEDVYLFWFFYSVFFCAYSVYIQWIGNTEIAIDVGYPQSECCCSAVGWIIPKLSIGWFFLFWVLFSLLLGKVAKLKEHQSLSGINPHLRPVLNTIPVVIPESFP